MLFVLLSIPFILLAGFIWKKYRELDWGTQSWHIPFFYGLSFTGFIILFLGVISYMYGKGENETIMVSGNSQTTKKELATLPSMPSKSKTGLYIYKHKRDTIELFPYIYSIVAQQLVTSQLLIPVILKDNDEFYLFRSSSSVLLLPCKKTKIEYVGKKNIVVIEYTYINDRSNREKIVLKEKKHIIKLKQQYLLLHYHKKQQVSNTICQMPYK